MKTISPSVFLDHLANGLNCCIYYFNEEKTLSKCIGKNLMGFRSIYLLSKLKRKNFLNNPHPMIKRKDIIVDNRTVRIEVVYTPIERKGKREGLLWVFLLDDQTIKSLKEPYVKVDESLLTMINTLSEIFPSLIDMREIKEINALYSQSSVFIGNLLSNGLMLYGEKDDLLFYNGSAEKMNLMNIDAEKLPNNKVLDLYTNEFYLGDKLIGRIKYTSGQNNIKNNFEHEKNTMKSFNKIIGKNPQLNRVLSTIDQIALTDSTVLLRGESGTGKEEYAKLLHNLSQRKNRPFVALNCSAIPENLLESELFGYEGGSFTGANKEGKIGKFQMAHTGTIFLDEIGDMPLSIQVKLLRVLQERCIEPVGSNKIIPIDVRIICATHQNLEDKIKKGELREDLFYRINVIPIDIPSLNRKHDDIESLLTYYIKKYCILQKKGFMIFSYDAMEALKNYHWQGNIRELINVVEYCVAMSNKDQIDLSDLPSYIRHNKPYVKNSSNDQRKKQGKPTKEELFRLVEKYGNHTEGKKKLAKDLNISLATLYRWISKYRYR